MPEYLAPGVFVEETSFRAKSIEGVSTTTTGFVGPTRYGPADLEPDLVTSLIEFERVYGGRSQLDFADQGKMHNYMWHAVRSFFEEGGKRLYVSRIYLQPDANNDGRATGKLPASASVDDAINVKARFPGQAGNVRVRFTLRLGQNILNVNDGKANVSSLNEGDIVLIADREQPFVSPPLSSSILMSPPPASPPLDFSPPSKSLGLFIAKYDGTEQTWRFQVSDSAADADLRLNHSDTSKGLNQYAGLEVRVLTLALTVIGVDGETMVRDGLPLDPSHRRGETLDAFSEIFKEKPANLSQARQVPIVITLGTNVKTGLEVFTKLNTASNGALAQKLLDLKSTDSERSVGLLLSGGSDGKWPNADCYKGEEKDYVKTGLMAFEDLEDISIVAAPGATFGLEASTDNQKRAQAITLGLISHAERMRYRIAVLDSGDGQTISQVRAMRAKLDSKHAALYYPWVKVLDPVTHGEIVLPPSGFVAGIYARNDIERAVYKAPANEVVRGAIGFETTINKSQQEVLNPEGINCFRFFEGRGLRLWGARTISSDSEWKYVNLRRYFAYLERSIDKGTQWAVFEPNGEQLWANVRRTIEDFMLNEWQSGALLGDKPEKAFFVKCDRSTMSQNDLDNGRLICLIGLAPLRPAEFVIFRIGQWTADRKV